MRPRSGLSLGNTPNEAVVDVAGVNCSGSMNLFLKCIVAIASSTVQSLGLTLQRASYMSVFLGPGDASERKNIYLWRVGVALFIAANLFGSTVQIALLPLALVCTLQAAGLVANSVFAWLLLHEPQNPPAIAGTCLIILGAILVAAFGGVREADPDLSLNQLLKLLYTRHFMLHLVFSLAVVFACVYRARKADLRASFQGVLYGLAGGILSAHSLLMAKITVGLLLRDMRKIFRDLSEARFWVVPILFLMFALGQMWCVNSGLQRISTSILFPLVFCIYNIVTLMNGLAFYGLKTMFEPKHLGFVIFGTFVLILGVGLLSSRHCDDANDTYDIEQQQQQSLNSLSSPLSPNLTGPFEPGSPVRREPDVMLGSPVSPRTRRPLASRPGPGLESPLLESPASGPQYTSLESLDPNIANPDKSRHRGNRNGRNPVLSKEQQVILRELYM